MEQHILSLRYDGLDAATHNGIGTAGSKQVIVGAQMFLGAHAHYYLDGTVPDRINDRAAGFAIRDIGRRQGSLIMEFAMGLLGSAVWDVANAIYGFDRMALESYKAFKARRVFEDPPYEWRQRSLQGPGMNEPVFDSALAREYQRRRLFQRTKQSVAYMTAPIGVTASFVELSINGRHFDTLNGRMASGEDIDEWLQVFRESNGTGRRLS